MLTIGDGALHRDLDAFGNPFQLEYLIALVVLICVYARWRVVRPPPRPFWRWQAIGASCIAITIVVGQIICGSHAHVQCYLFGLMGAVYATGCLVVELQLAPRLPAARVVR